MDSIIQNILNGDHIEVWSVTISKFAFLTGLIFVASGLYMRVKNNRIQGRDHDTTGSNITIIAGIMLLSLEAFIKMLAITVFGSGDTDFYFTKGMVVIKDTMVENSGDVTIYLSFAVYIMMLVGLIAVFRGLCLFKRANQRSENLGGAMWHWFGGILALNFTTFMQVIGNSAGNEVQSIISKLFG